MWGGKQTRLLFIPRLFLGGGKGTFSRGNQLGYRDRFSWDATGLFPRWVSDVTILLFSVSESRTRGGSEWVGRLLLPSPYPLRLVLLTRYQPRIFLCGECRYGRLGRLGDRRRFQRWTWILLRGNLLVPYVSFNRGVQVPSCSGT